MRETSSKIDAAATAWALRAQESSLTPRQDAELRRWLEADSRNLGAYTRAAGVLAYFDHAAALKPGAASAAQRSPILSRRQWFGGALAAGLGGLAAATGWAWSTLQARLSAQKGEIRVVALQDGSQVALDSQSTVQVAFDPRRRMVRLVDGEALFDVVKDATRPFVVMAANTQVRAIGTSFSVRLLPHGDVRVLVREGQVEVVRAPLAGAAPAARLLLSANMSTLATDAPILRAVVETSETVDRQLAWRNGMLDFAGASLDQAAAQFARYSDYALHVDPDVANQRVTGRFMATDARGFARAVAESLGVTVEFGEQSANLHR